MILIKALFASFLILVAGLNCLTETTALAQTDPIQLTDVRLSEYRLTGGPWTPVAAGTPVPASAVELRFRARVNRPEGQRVLLKVALHEACFRRSNNRFVGRFKYVESAEPADGTPVGLDGSVLVDVETECVRCQSVCNRGCPQREHLGEGPHMASLTVADPRESAGANLNGFQSLTYRVDFETVCPPRRDRPPRRVRPTRTRK